MNTVSKKIFIFYLVLGAISGMFSVNFAIIVFFGLMPSILACSLDRLPQLYLSKIIVMFNILGMLVVFMPIILINDKDFDVIAYSISVRPVSWLVMYSFCAAGWVYYYVMPKIIELWIRYFSEIKTCNLKCRLKNIERNYEFDE